MEITAKCKFDKAAIRALAHIQVYRRSEPKKAFFTKVIWGFVLLLVLLAELVIWGLHAFPLLMLGFTVLIIVWEYYMYALFPLVQYRTLAKMKDMENTYTFYDDAVKIITKSEEYQGEARMEYTMLKKVLETSEYFFLYQTNNLVFIVDKSTVENGTAKEIGDRLSVYVKDQYQRCKY